MAFDMGTFPLLFPSVSILQVMVQRHSKLGLWFREGNFNMKALVMATTFWYCYLQGTWACLGFYYSPVQPLLLCWASRVEGFPTLLPNAASRCHLPQLSSRSSHSHQHKTRRPTPYKIPSVLGCSIRKMHFKVNLFPENTTHFLIIRIFLRCLTK